MTGVDRRQAYTVLAMTTIAFGVCFAVWMMNGVLITYLVNAQAYEFTRSEMGFLIGLPVLTGAIMRLPVGVLTDKYGGRRVYAAVMIVGAFAAWMMSYADSFWGFALGGLGFGLTGASFAVGIAYTSVWFERERQGTVLGIFGAGNAGAAVTSMGAPWLLGVFTEGGTIIEGWRWLPRTYAIALLVMTVIFWIFTWERRAEGAERTLVQRLQPLKNIRVWRFGLYYFLVFGGFVALAQWLIPYYVNVYGTTVAVAGLMASIFTLPSGLIRALGGWMSDKFGARTIMYWVLGGCALGSLLLLFPRMDILAPGEGVTAARSGTVEAVSDEEVVVDGKVYPLQTLENAGDDLTDRAGVAEEGTLILPTARFWQRAVVEVGDEVPRKALLAKGITHVYFQANIWIFTGIVFVIGILMGIGKAAVYKHIPEYFPNDIGVVGGIVGVLGGLGGFVCPILFGWMLGTTGIWTTCWFFFFVLSMTCLVWMHRVVKRMIGRQAPHLKHRMDEHHPADTADDASTHSDVDPADGTAVPA